MELRPLSKLRLEPELSSNRNLEDVRAWRSVLARLPPKDVSRAALACRSLALAARHVTLARSSDACHGCEAFAVPFLNDLDDEKYSFFHYLKHCSRGVDLDLASVSSWGDTLMPKSDPPPSMRNDEISLEENNFDHIAFSENQFRGCFGGDGCKCAFKHEFNEQITSETPNKQIHDNTFLHASCNSSSCPCGFTTDGDRAYDLFGRLRILSDFTSHNLQCEKFKDDGLSNVDSHSTHEIVGLADYSQMDDAISCANTDANNEHSSSPPPTLMHSELISIFECGPACTCGIFCINRVSQRGLSVPVVLKKHKFKGWCLHSAAFLSPGTFVCEYSGELLTTREAQRRQCETDSMRNSEITLQAESRHNSYLLVVREHLPSGKVALRLNIDPTYSGNVARFINHSCDGGNLLPCLVRSIAWPIPRVSFFAKKTIQPDEELTYSYGGLDESNTLGRIARNCYCGSYNCIGILPREET